MNITFDELRTIKHSLPTGSIAKIAQKLEIEQQTVRNYFGAKKYEDGKFVPVHLQPGPGGGIVQLEELNILDAAKELLTEANAVS